MSLSNETRKMATAIRNYEALLKEAATLFRKYEESHRERGPEHLAKAEVNGEIAGRIEAVLNSYKEI